MINGELQKLRQEVASNDRGEDKNTYTAEIDTNRYTLSKSGKRQEMLIVLEVGLRQLFFFAPSPPVF